MSAEKVAHTPGPWRVGGNYVFAQDGFVALVGCVHRTPAEGDANARLIAAAPDLLALAKRYASECRECDGEGRILVTFNDREAEYDSCDACADIRAAIAKAEGGA